MLKPALTLAALFALAFGPAFAQPRKCPVINGKYSYIEMRNGLPFARHSITMFTRIADGIFSYAADKEGNFQAADGVGRPKTTRGFRTTVRMTCKEGSLVIDTRAVDSDDFYFQKLTPKNEREVFRESSTPAMTGLYILQQ